MGPGGNHGSPPDLLDDLRKRWGQRQLPLDGGEDGPLQNVLPDGMPGAARPGAIPVCPAGIVDMALGAASGHAPFAVRAAEETGEQIDLLLPGRRADVPGMERLGRLEEFLADDGRDGVLHQDPLPLRHGDAPVDLVADHPLAALTHGPGVHRVLEHPGNGGGIPQSAAPGGVGIRVKEALPPFVGGGIGDAAGIQAPGDGRLAHAAGDKPGVDIPHHPGGLPIDDQGVLILRVFGVAVGRESADELPLFPLISEGPAHIHGGLVSVLLVHEARDADLQTVYHLRVQEGVDPGMVQGDEPGVVEGDELLQKTPLVGAVAEGPGEILHHDAVDPPPLQVPHHALEVPPLQVGRAAGPVIDVRIHDLIGPGLEKTRYLILQDLILMDDRLRNVVPIVPGEPDVLPDPPDGLLRRRPGLSPLSDPPHGGEPPPPHARRARRRFSDPGNRPSPSPPGSPHRAGRRPAPLYPPPGSGRGLLLRPAGRAYPAYPSVFADPSCKAPPPDGYARKADGITETARRRKIVPAIRPLATGFDKTPAEAPPVFGLPPLRAPVQRNASAARRPARGSRCPSGP